jgi:hypothetical protein
MLTLLKVFFLVVAKVFGILLKIPAGMVPCLRVFVCVCACACVKRRGNKLCRTKNNLRTATLQGRLVELFSIRKEVESSS